jgi:hypothetical protein
VAQVICFTQHAVKVDVNCGSGDLLHSACSEGGETETMQRPTADCCDLAKWCLVLVLLFSATGGG